MLESIPLIQIYLGGPCLINIGSVMVYATLKFLLRFDISGQMVTSSHLYVPVAM